MPKPWQPNLILCILMGIIAPFANAQLPKEQPGPLLIFGDQKNLPKSAPFTKHLFPQANGVTTNAPVCSTSTFSLRISSAANEKVELSKLQTFPDGNFLGVGTITQTSGAKEGL